MIDGVYVKPLRQIPDERGKIMHMLRSDDPLFEKFGEVFFSVTYPGVVKGWHLHTRIAQYYAVVVGMIKLVLCDDRDGSPTRGEIDELFVGESNYCLVKMPAGIWYGLKAIGGSPAMVANCSTEPHDPSEVIRMDPFCDKIAYDWSLQQK